VTTDRAGPYLRVLAELVPAAAHVTEQYSNNRIEADHGRLKARLRPMRGLKQVGSDAGQARPRRRLYRGNGQLARKTAVITSGDSGIGRAVAVPFARGWQPPGAGRC
jgi:hypothetical protein